MAVGANERVEQWLNGIVILEIENPIVREGDDGINIDLEAADYVAIEWLVF